MTRLVLIVLLMLASFGGFAQDSLSGCKNALKVDLVGIPMAFLYLPHATYPRLSLEYERRFHADSRGSWVADVEYSVFNEEYPDSIDGQVVEMGNEQQSLSAIGGVRLYLFYGASKKWKRVFYVEPRLGFSFSRSKLTPFTFDPIPVRYETKFYALPRFRGGISIALSRHLGIDGSIDFLILNSLGSEWKSISQVFELNFIIAF
jgi:hypothetical protein